MVKKVLKKCFGLSALAAIVLSFATCGDNTGLGGQVDVEAPTLEISYPPVSAAVRGTFTLAGTWNDDMVVSQIILTITNNTTKQTYPANTVTVGADKSWSVQVNDYNAERAEYNGWELPDGKYELSVVAYDASGHKSGAMSRTVEVDNTAPVVVLTNPGTTDIEAPSKYGSNFKVSGTIADEHTISAMSIKIYDKNGNLINSDPYTETSVPTAGGTSVTLLKFDAEGSLEVNERYKNIYYADPSTVYGDTVPYYCSITVTDAAKEYTNPAEESNTTSGNSTSTFYLNSDIYESLLSEKSGMGLSAADLMTILNGTFADSSSARAAAGSDVAATVIAKLQEFAINTEQNKLAFSLNPAVNPSYTVSGYKLANKAAAVAEQPITVIVSMGLDETQLKPATFKAYLKNFGKDEPSEADVAEFLTQAQDNPDALAAAVDNETVYLIRDLENGNDIDDDGKIDKEATDTNYDVEAPYTGQTLVDTYQMQARLPKVVSNGSWYVIALVGKDGDGESLRSNGQYGFIGALSGIPPTVTINEFDQTAYNDVDKIVFTGTASSSSTMVRSITYFIEQRDLDANTTTVYPTGATADTNGTIKNGKTVAFDTDAGTTWVKTGDAANGTWEILLDDSLKSNIDGKNMQYTLYITAIDDQDISTTGLQKLSILLDKKKPVLAYSGTALSTVSSAKNNIGNSDTNYTQSGTSYDYRFAGTLSDVNGSGIEKLYYTITANDATPGTPLEDGNYDGTTTQRNLNVFMTVGQQQNVTLEVYVKDKAGNESNHLKYENVTFDYENPVRKTGETEVTRVTSSVTGGLQIAGAITDNLVLPTAEQTGTTSVTGYGVTVTGKKNGTAQDVSSYVTLTQTNTTETGYAINVPVGTNGSNDGTWVFTIDAADKVGNKLASASKREVTAIIDTVNPTVGTPAFAQDRTGRTGNFFNSTVPFVLSVTADDGTTGSGVDTVQYFAVKGDKVSAGWKDEYVTGTDKVFSDWGSLVQQADTNGTLTTTWKATVSEFATANTESGDYTIFVKATDKLGNVSYSSGLLMKADNEAPIVEETAGEKKITLDATTQTYKSFETATFTLTGTATDQNGNLNTVTYTLAKDGGTASAAQTLTLNDGTWTISTPEGAASGGTFAYQITATDKAGNSYTYKRTVTVDKTAPTLTVTQLNGTALTTSTTTKLANATFKGNAKDEDGGSGISEVTAWYVASTVAAADRTKEKVLADNPAAVQQVTPDQNGDFDLTIYSLAEGNYILFIEAKDAANNTTYLGGGTAPGTGQAFGIDTSAPTSTLKVTAAVQQKTETTANNTTTTTVTPLDASTNYGHGAAAAIGNRWNDNETYIAKETFTLSGTISDTFGYDAADITLTKGTATTNLLPSSFTGTGLKTKDWSYTETVTENTANGTNTYKLTVKDKAGNQATYAFIVQIDNTKPTVTITQPTDGAGVTTAGEVSIAGNAFDTGVGIQKVTYTVKKGTETVVDGVTASLDGGKWTGSTSITEEGTLSITATATDWLGQTSTTDSVSFTYDKTPPELSDAKVTTTKTTDYFNDKSVSIEATVTDAISGVANVQYSIDGGTTKKSMNMKSGGSTAAGGSATYEATISFDSDGAKTVTIYATDTLGNISVATATDNKYKPQELSFTIDTTKPTFGAITKTGVSNASDDASNTDVTFSGTVSDALGLKSFVVTAQRTQDVNGVATKAAVQTLPFNAPSITSDASALTLPVKTAVSDGEFTFTLPASAANDGTWEFTLTATDNAGNTQTATTEVLIDKTAPQFTDDNFANGSVNANPEKPFKIGGKLFTEGTISPWYKDTTLSVVGYVTEAVAKAGSGVTKVEYILRAADSPEDAPTADTTGWTANVLDTNKSNGTIKYNGEISGFTNGAKLWFKVTDAAGNSSVSGVHTVKVDGTTPEVKEFTTAGGSTYSFTTAEGSTGKDEKTIQFLVCEADSGLNESSIAISVGDKKNKKNGDTGLTISVADPTDAEIEKNTSITNDTKASYKVVTVKMTAENYLTGLNGTLGISATLQDNAGNSWSGTIATIEIDTLAPTIAISSVTPTVAKNSKSNVNKTITVTGTASDTKGIDVVFVTATANNMTKTAYYAGTDFTYNEKSYQKSNGTGTFDESANLWTVTFDTTEFYNATDSKDITITAVAKDRSGNWNASDSGTGRTPATTDRVIDQNTDRPVIKLTNMTTVGSGENIKYIIKNIADAHIEGSVSDDDQTSTATVKQLYVAGAKTADSFSWGTYTDATETAAGYLTGWTLDSSDSSIFKATHTTYGTVELTLSTGEWTYTPADALKADGQRTLYFYVVDNNGTKFATANTAQLERPYWVYKTDTTENDTQAALTYYIDGTSPEVVDHKIEATAYDAATDGNAYDNGKLETVDYTYVAGGAGTTKRYVAFTIKAKDDNGISGMRLTLEQGSTTKKFVTSAAAKANTTDTDTVSGTMKADGSSTTQFVWTTDRIDMDVFADGSVTVTVVPIDNCGQTGNERTSFKVDKNGPEVTVSAPSKDTEQIGNVTVSGASGDEGAGASAIQFAVPAKGKTFATDKANVTYGGRLSSTATASYWSFVFGGSNANDALSTYIVRSENSASLTDATYAEKQKHAVTKTKGKIEESTDIWQIPIWFKATDAIGNVSYTEYYVTYNPNADMPITSISYPSESDYTPEYATTGTGDEKQLAKDANGDPIATGLEYVIVGGTLRVNGSVSFEDSNAEVAMAFLQVGKVTYTYSDDRKTLTNTAYDWASNNALISNSKTVDGHTLITVSENNGSYTLSQTYEAIKSTDAKIVNVDSGWWGIAANTKAFSWNINLNANNQYETEDYKDIAIRACAVNTSGKMGNWSEPVLIRFDNSAPTVSAKLKQFKNTTASEITSSTQAVAEKEYEAGMYLRNPNGDWYFEVTIADTDGINEGNTKVSGASSLKKELTDGAKTGYVYFPVSAMSGAATYTVYTEDKASPVTHTTSKTLSLYIDNEAPVMGELTDTSKKSSIAYQKIRNSNYNVSMTANATDAHSGFNMLAYYFKRTDGQTVTIELPIPTLKSGNKDEGVWTKTDTAKIQTVGSGVTLDSETGLYGVTQTVTRSATNTLTLSSNDAITNGIVRVGSLVRLGGNYVTITALSGSTATLSKDIPTTYTSAFFAMAFVVDNNGESSTWDSGNYTLKSDDGDGIYERKLASSWTSEFCSDGLEDGPISIVCSAFDVAENVATQETKVMIANNTPRLTKVFLATDLNGDGKYAQSEFVEGSVYISRTVSSDSDKTQDMANLAAKSYLSALDTAAESDTAVVTVGGNIGDWVDDSDTTGTTVLTDKFRMSGDSVMTFEFVSGKEGYGSGNNNMYAYLTVGNAALTAPETTGARKLSSALATLSGTAYGYAAAFTSNKGIVLGSSLFTAATASGNARATTYGTFTESTAAADNQTQYLSLTLWDTTKGSAGDVETVNEGASNVVFGNQYTVLNIPVYFDFEDDSAPKAVVTPFYWKSAYDTNGNEVISSSLYYDTNGNRLGHIDLGEYRGTTPTGIPAVSGVIKVEGTAEDNMRLSALSVAVNGTETASSTYDPTKSTWTNKGTLATDKYEFTVKDEYLTQAGHKVAWTLYIDTASKIQNGNGRYITVTATQAKESSGKQLASVPGTTQTGWNTSTKQLDETKYTGYYQMDVVPYITKIDRGSATAIAQGIMNRSKLGHYPVSEGETITVYGYNFTNTPTKVEVGGIDVTSKMTAGSAQSSVTKEGSFTLVVPANSGNLRVTATTASLNNSNADPVISGNTKPTADKSKNYNLEEITMKGSSQTFYDDDDRYLEVWNLGNFFANTGSGADVSKPVMTADASGNLYASWVAQSNSIVAFSYGMTNNYTPIFRCYDQPAVLNSIAFDTKGTSGAASVGFMPEHQGQGGTFSGNAMSDTKIIGGAGAISIPKDYITNKTTLSGTAITVTGNPVFNVDSSNTTAYYNLANYDMNRRLGSFTNPKSARFNNFLHTIWYDEVNESVKYSVVNTSQKDDFNQNGGAIAGWVLIDGGWTGQDRVHDWTKTATDNYNTLSSSTNADEHTWVGTKRDPKKNRDAGTYAHYPKDIFVQGNNYAATGISALTVNSGFTNLGISVDGAVDNDVQVGDSVALLNNNTGSYAITITSISEKTGNNGYFVKFKDAPSHAVTAVTVYQGNMNVVGGTVVRNINTFKAADNQSSSAGLSSDIDVDKAGRPVIAYLDSTNSTLRVARFNTGSEVTLANMKLAGNWTRTVVPDTTCAGEVSLRVDSNNNIHIIYQNEDGYLCYTFGTPSENTYIFNKPEIIDTTGTMNYGSISLKQTSGGYVPVATYVNKAGTAHGLKYAYRKTATVSDTATVASNALNDNWDFMIIPMITGSEHYVASENRVSLEAYKDGWANNTATTVLQNQITANANTNTATPATVQAVVAYKSKQFETAYLREAKSDGE